MSSRKYTEVAGNSGGLNYKAIGCLASCLSLILVGIVLTVYNYHRTVMDEREETDMRNTSIYEPFLDKYTDKHINCTQQYPCKYTCGYVKEHFRQHPDDCEYEDWHHVIRIVCEVWLVIAVIGCCCESCNKKVETTQRS